MRGREVRGQKDRRRRETDERTGRRRGEKRKGRREEKRREGDRIEKQNRCRKEWK